MKRFRPTKTLMPVLAVICLVVVQSSAIVAAAQPEAAEVHSDSKPVLLIASPKLRRLTVAAEGMRPTSRPGIQGIPRPLYELTKYRTARSSVWKNADGSISVRSYAQPQFYRDGTRGTWLPIDPALHSVPGKQLWVSGANSWQVAFGTPGGSGGMEQIRVGGQRFSMSPVGTTTRSLTPVVAGTSASYRDLWPGVDALENVSSTGVTEALILRSRTAASTYDFRLSGATARLIKSGALQLTVGSQSAGEIPQPTVLLSGNVLGSGSGPLQMRSGVGYRLVGDRIELSVSRAWLGSLPASDYPVTIDPSWTSVPSASNVIYYNSVSNNYATNAVYVGQNGSTGPIFDGAAKLNFPSPPTVPSGQQPWVPTDASLTAQCSSSNGCPMTSGALYGETAEPQSYSTVFQVPAQQLLWSSSGQEILSIGGNITSWFVAHTSGSWFGFTGMGGTTLASHTTVEMPPGDIVATIVYHQEPPAPTLVSPAATSEVASTTPTLTTTTTDTNICTTSNQAPVNGQLCDQPASISYDFKISTSADPLNGQTVVDSGWVPQNFSGAGTSASPWVTANTKWVVPAGALSDGVRYYVSVQSADTNENPEATGSSNMVPPAAALPSTQFTVKLRLGAGGPSPTDTVGSVPGSTTTPSNSAPSPGLPTAAETVNLVTGNLSASLSTPSMAALGGAAGVNFSYDSNRSSTTSGSNYGLTGSYYADSGAHVFSGQPLATTVVPDVNTTATAGGAEAPPVGALAEGQPYLVRWVGTITLSSAASSSWQLGGDVTGGMRIYLDGSTTPLWDDWNGAASGVVFARSSVSPGSHQIEVDAWAPSTATTLQLWANSVDQSIPSVVPSSWLTPLATGLPPGWSMGTASARWTSITDVGTQVVLHAPSGATETFTNNGNGTYTSPPGDSDELVTNGQGVVQLTTADGYLYEFNQSGQLVMLQTVADPLHPTSLTYTYGSIVTGGPVVLQAITDPVSGRSVSLSYGSSTSCSSPNTLGLLCGISYWDSTSSSDTTSSYLYNANGQLAEVINPGNEIYLFGYDPAGRLDDIRDPLVNAVLAAGGPSAPTCSSTVNQSCLADTWIVYDSTTGRVSSVTQPEPAIGQLRPQRTYTYTPPAVAGTGPGTAQMSVTGLTPQGHYFEKVTYDAQSRVYLVSNASGAATTTLWDDQDRPIVTLDREGEQTSVVYDVNSNATDTYGPAPAACFDPATLPSDVVGVGNAVGYLPLANSSSVAGCNTAVPHTHTGYDEGMPGLGETYWSNGGANGATAAHATGYVSTAGTSCPGPQPPSGVTWTTDQNLCGEWANGQTPSGVSTDSNGQWAMHMHGTINMPSAGDWTFCVFGYVPTTVLINGVTVASNMMYTGTSGQLYYGYPAGMSASYSGITHSHCEDGVLAPVAVQAGLNNIEVQVQGSTSASQQFTISYAAPGSTDPAVAIPNSALTPGYGLATSSIDADGLTTATTYAAANLGAEFGLATSTTAAPGTTSALTTSTSYETPSSTTYLRRLTRTLPAGGATTYQYYSANTPGPIAAQCGVGSGTVEGGQLEAQIDPSATPGGVTREQQFIYDSRGRQVGRRVGPTTSISSLGWQCTSFDDKGRIASQSWPATSTAPARVVTYTYSVGGNPLTNSVSDTSGTITSTVDLLGRPVSYTDSSGLTTTTAYNQAGQVVTDATPSNTIAMTYDSASSQVATVTVGSTTLATATYDSKGERLASVVYSNGTTTTPGYDTLGRENSLGVTKTSGGGFVAGDQTTESPAGRVTTEQLDISGTGLSNPNPAGSSAVDYTYDPDGRLISAYEPGGVATYSYAANASSDGCAFPGQGANTNRTNVTFTPVSGSPSSVDYCYDGADHLVSSVSGGVVSNGYAYDSRGNQIQDGAKTLTWDASDRVATTTVGGSTTTYTYDPLDRVLEEKSPTVDVVYGYSGFSDAATSVTNRTTGSTVALVTLPGGALASLGPQSAVTWSYSDLHGNYTVTTNNSGTVQGQPTIYDPWGGVIDGSTLPSNTGVPWSLGARGANGKVTDPVTGLTVMGARLMNPTEGRFLSADPVDGGCANEYTYAFGDPINHPDLSGKNSCDQNPSFADYVKGAFQVIPKLAKVVGLPLGPTGTGLIVTMVGSFVSLAASQQADDADRALAAQLAAMFSGSPSGDGVLSPSQRETLAEAYVSGLLSPSLAAGSLYQIGQYQWQIDCWKDGMVNPGFNGAEWGVGN